MDDPWGSPWTTTATATHTDDKYARAPSPTKSTRSELEPPPRAFLSVSSSPRLPAISGQSPWADENDGFGDWAAPDTPGATQASGWGGGWAAPSPKLTSPAQNDDFGGVSPIAWPGSIALSKPANLPTARQPSPDPWSAEFSPSIDGVSTPRLVVDAPPSPIALDETREDVTMGETTWRLEDQSHIEGEIRYHPETQQQTVEKSAAVSQAKNNETEGARRPVNGVRPSIEAAADHESPSSPSDDDTDHDEDRLDSPMTSIDEDAKTRQPAVRKASGKVQELVVKFDGLARALSEEPPVVRHHRSKSPSGAGGDQDGDDTAEFGDFEDEAKEPVEVQAPERPATPEQPPTVDRQPETPTPVTSPQVARGSPSRMQKIIADHGPMSFDVDMVLVDKLFDGLRLSLPDTTGEHNGELPDHIITDNFTEISERKTWYRISRMGSSRKYNAGDDENYRLVTWPASTIREDTMKVVRRWMEEDSIAGRVTLGGGISKTQKNMFGWDSSVEPVALDTVFGRRKHSRGPSISARKTSGSLRSPALAMPPVPTFGWSTGSPTLPQAPSPGLIPPPPGSATLTPKPVVPATAPLAAKNPTPPALIPPAPAAPDAAGQDDEDEWGEMVSSPSEVKATQTVFPSLEEAFASQPPSHSVVQEEETIVPAPVNAVAPAQPADPWAVADFSIFESPPKPAGASLKQPTVPDILGSTLAPDAASRATPISSSTFDLPANAPESGPISGLAPTAAAPTKQPFLDHTFTPTTPLEIASPVALPGSAEEYFPEDDGQPSQDDAVRGIIANLPDLSYMLR